MRYSVITFVMVTGLVVPAGQAGASDQAGYVSAGTQIGLAGDIGVEAVSFSHADCVGPGLPGTAGPHTTHTTNVPGFVIDPARVVSFRYTPLTLLGAGICPTTVGGPVLPQDYTGRWQMTAVCRQTSNDGAIFLNWIVDSVAGAVTGQGSAGVSCVGLLGAAFSLDITVALSPTDVPNVGPAGPLGGELLTVTQA